MPHEKLASTNETSLLVFQNELASDLELFASSPYKKDVLNKVAQFIIDEKQDSANSILEHYFKAYPKEQAHQTAIKEIIDGFIKKNQAVMEKARNEATKKSTQTDTRKTFQSAKPSPIKKTESVGKKKKNTLPEDLEIDQNPETSEKKLKRETPLLNETMNRYKNEPKPQKPKILVESGADYKKEKTEESYEISDEAQAEFDKRDTFKKNSRTPLDAIFPEIADTETIKNITKDITNGTTYEDADFIYTVTNIQENGTISFMKTHKESGTVSPIRMKPETLADKVVQGKLAVPTSSKKPIKESTERKKTVYGGTGTIDGYARTENPDGSYSYTQLYKSSPAKTVSTKNLTTSENTHEVKTSPNTEVLDADMITLGWNKKDLSYMTTEMKKDAILNERRKPIDSPKDTETAKMPLVDSTNDGEKLLSNIDNWMNKDILIEEKNGFVDFILTDPKNKNNRDTLRFPTTHTAQIEALKKVLQKNQESQTHKTETISYAVGDSFTNIEKGKKYTISKIQGTLVYLTGEKDIIESTKSLSELIEKGVYKKNEEMEQFIIGQRFQDETKTVLTITSIRGSLVTFSDGTKEHIETIDNVHEFLKAGDFIKLEQTTNPPDSIEVTTSEENKDSLGSLISGISQFSESFSKKLMAYPQNWPQEVLDIMNIKELTDAYSTNLIYGAEERTKYEKLLHDHKIASLQEIVKQKEERYRKMEERLAEINTILDEYKREQNQIDNEALEKIDTKADTYSTELDKPAEERANTPEILKNEGYMILANKYPEFTKLFAETEILREQKLKELEEKKIEASEKLATEIEEEIEQIHEARLFINQILSIPESQQELAILLEYIDSEKKKGDLEQIKEDIKEIQHYLLNPLREAERKLAETIKKSKADPSDVFAQKMIVFYTSLRDKILGVLRSKKTDTESKNIFVEN